ncbi:YdeI/OmpD-associated family protein [Negadavirga shengliensis]|uniref:YdeI family protein n=1 Tax=Negadavirga shengliensis TaxID=1389218 RepID=A0ABV9T6P3_9BACT
MEKNNGIPAMPFTSREDWRRWLEDHHTEKSAIFMIIYRQKSQIASLTYEEAVEEALCFGWIDSKANKRDADSYYLYFAPRNAKSRWSKINRDRVAKMESQGLMRPSGQELVDLAKSTGTWEALMDVENLVIPADLLHLLDSKPEASKNFQAFSPSSRKIILEWIMSAKRPETRQKRIMETVRLAEINVKAHHPGR